MGRPHAIARLRADAGFFDHLLLEFLEERGLSYIVVARFTLSSVVRAVAKFTGLPSPSTLPEYPSTSPSRNKWRAAIDRSPTAEFAPVINRP